MQIWNWAVLVPKTYRETLAGSATETTRLPVEQEVHTPPCFMQKEHVHARAGISVGSGSQSNLNETFRQWQLPPMITDVSCVRVTTPND
jgi:hypothetical protein